MNKFEGSINQVNIKTDETHILGWMWDRKNPDITCHGAITLNKEVLKSFESGIFREDLKKNAIGNGHHAFSITLNFPLKPEQIEKLKLHPINDEKNILAALAHHAPNVIFSKEPKPTPEAKTAAPPATQTAQATQSTNSQTKANPAPPPHNTPVTTPDLSERIDQELEKISHQGGGRDEALSHLQNVLSDHPDNYSVHHKLGDFFYNLEEYDQAIQYYQKAIELNPNAFWSYHNLSMTHSRMDNWPKAEELLDKVNEINPGFWHEMQNNFWIQLHRAGYFHYKNDREKALEFYKNAFLLEPQSSEVLYYLMEYYLNYHHQVIELLLLLNQSPKLQSNTIDNAVEKFINQQRQSNHDPMLLLKKYQSLLIVFPESFLALHEIKKVKKQLDDSEHGNDYNEEDNPQIENFRNQLDSFNQFLDIIEDKLKA